MIILSKAIFALLSSPYSRPSMPPIMEQMATVTMETLSEIEPETSASPRLHSI